MKPNWTFVTVFFGVVAVGFAHLAYCEDPNTIDEKTLLQAEVTMLRSQVKAQAAEIERLKAQLAQAGAPKTGTQPAIPTTAPAYTFLGRPITAGQFAQFYRDFGNRMIVADGKVLDAGEAAAWEDYHRKYYSEHRDRTSPPQYVSIPGYVPDTPPPVGTVCKGNGVVSSVTREGIIVDLERRRGIVGVRVSPTNVMGQPTESSVTSYRIRGVDVKKYADGSEVALPKVVYVGTCKVAGRTLQDYVLAAPVPTEGQFADALAKGLQLSRWTVQQKPNQPPEAVAVPVK